MTALREYKIIPPPPPPDQQQLDGKSTDSFAEVSEESSIEDDAHDKPSHTHKKSHHHAKKQKHAPPRFIDVGSVRYFREPKKSYLERIQYQKGSNTEVDFQQDHGQNNQKHGQTHHHHHHKHHHSHEKRHSFDDTYQEKKDSYHGRAHRSSVHSHKRLESGQRKERHRASEYPTAHNNMDTNQLNNPKPGAPSRHGKMEEKDQTDEVKAKNKLSGSKTIQSVEKSRGVVSEDKKMSDSRLQLLQVVSDATQAAAKQAPSPTYSGDVESQTSREKDRSEISSHPGGTISNTNQVDVVKQLSKTLDNPAEEGKHSKACCTVQ